MSFDSFLSATIVVAIILFFAKEILESIRRYRARERARRANRLLLKRECELNYWVYTCLFRIASQLQADVNSGVDETYAVARRSDQSIAFRTLHIDGFSETTIPPTRIAVIEKLLLDAASNDGSLYEVLQQAYEAMIDMEHVRESLFRHVEDEDGDGFLAGFHNFALNELADSLVALRALYKECTGEVLTTWQVR